jgi:RNA polymerase sigma-70 factor (ECF subfamily)
MTGEEQVFAEHRGLLFGVAYRMLGSVADAEDTVQDAWLRWSAHSAESVANPKAYLVRVVTRLALNRLRDAAARRETYIGPWLPEPLLHHGGPTGDAAAGVELAESVYTAMLVVLETLSPLERAVFVLHEVFGFGYREIAGMVDRGEPAIRQLAHRAREHVQARRPRFDPDPEVRRQVTEEFIAAAFGGDLRRLLELLAPDVTMWTDGGGKAKAARRPIHGADKVARFAIGIARGEVPEMGLRFLDVGDEPAVLVTSAGKPYAFVSLAVVDGRIAEAWVVNNPDKLTGVQR